MFEMCVMYLHIFLFSTIIFKHNSFCTVVEESNYTFDTDWKVIYENYFQTFVYFCFIEPRVCKSIKIDSSYNK